MENTELIKALRICANQTCCDNCPRYDIDHTQDAQRCCIQLINDAADALEALLKERAEMIAGAKKTAKVYAKFYEKYIELEEQMAKIKSQIYDLENIAKRAYDDDPDNEYLEGYFDGLHHAAKLISTVTICNALDYGEHDEQADC